MKLHERLLAATSALAMTFCCAFGSMSAVQLTDFPNISIMANAEETGTYGDLTYKKYDDYVVITGCDNSATKVEIPSEIDGLPVTSIGGYAFDSCTSLTSITIPDSVTSIGSSAFWGCTSLTNITIPDSVTSIGDCAFEGCASLTNITIPDSVTSIGAYAFSDCTSLTSITILNPECEIDDSGSTICSGFDSGFYFNGTIYGYDNSTAQAYAETYGYAFESLGAAPATSTEDNGDVEYMLANGITLDFNNDGQVDAKDASMILIYATQHGAGLVKNLEEFIENQNQ